jgi:hypothetical protein
VIVVSRFVSAAGWPGEVPRGWLDLLFEENDAEAHWRGWQIIKLRGGLARRYRDPRFDRAVS